MCQYQVPGPLLAAGPVHAGAQVVPTTPMPLHAAASLLPPNPLQLAAALSLAGKWGAQAQLEELGSGAQDSVLALMTQAAQVC